VEIEITYRGWYKYLPPQPIKLKIPGWAGEDNEHKDGDKPQPWYCPPFVDGATYALELLYPFDTECHIINENGLAKVQGDWEKERPGSHAWPPFDNFAPGFYGFTSCLDIKVPPGYVLRLEPHPSYFTDQTWSVPCVVPGHLQTEWWPKIFFIVFKIPAPGQTHIFKKNNPYAQILIVPKKIEYKIKEMTEQEAKERSELEANIGKFAEKSWKDHKGNMFDDKYKVLSRVSNKKELDKHLKKKKTIFLRRSK